METDATVKTSTAERNFQNSCHANIKTVEHYVGGERKIKTEMVCWLLSCRMPQTVNIYLLYLKPNVLKLLYCFKGNNQRRHNLGSHGVQEN